jgi:flagellar motor protein MotB
LIYFFYKVCLFLIIAYYRRLDFFAEFEMKVFLTIAFFMFFSFLGAEEPQTPAQDQNNNAEAAAEASAEKAPEAAPAEAAQVESAPAEAAPVEAEAKPAEEPKAEEAKQPEAVSSENADEQGYNLKLRALEEKIDSLKDKIFKSKQRLAILQETVLGGTVGGSTVTIIHKNDTGSLFRLVSAVYYFDDKPIFKKVDLPEELEEKELQVYDAAVVPGPHRVSVYYVFTGRGYGFFSYMKDYSVKITADHSFTLEEGDMVEVEVAAVDKGSMYNFDNRIGVSFSVNKNTFENRDSAQEE